MDVKLVVAKGNCHPRHLHLRGPRTVIGRQRGSTVRIPSPEVSRQHCQLRIENGCLTVEDLNSSNGTFLNGERVLSPEIVHPGDHLQVGPLTFIVEYEMSEESVDPRFARSAELEDQADDFEEGLLSESVPDEPVRKPSPPPDSTTRQSTRWKDDVDAPIPLLDIDGPDEEKRDDDKRETSLAGESWHLPDGADLRNFLAKLDDTDREEEPE